VGSLWPIVVKISQRWRVEVPVRDTQTHRQTRLTIMAQYNIRLLFRFAIGPTQKKQSDAAENFHLASLYAMPWVTSRRLGNCSRMLVDTFIHPLHAELIAPCARSCACVPVMYALQKPLAVYKTTLHFRKETNFRLHSLRRSVVCQRLLDYSSTVAQRS